MHNVKGFVKNESIVTNGLCHVKSRNILCIDLKDFFPSIHFGRVMGMYQKRPFNFDNYTAKVLAIASCYQSKLPQGSPLSPLISNIICFKLDYMLRNYCNKYKCIYTRYADDITISTRSYTFPTQIASKEENVVSLNENIKKIIEKNKFEINDSKTKLNFLSYRQEVTGLIVNTTINVPKVFIKKLRGELDYISKCKYKEYAEINKIKTSDKGKIYYIALNKIRGKISYLGMVRGKKDKIFLSYAEKFNKAFGDEYFDTSFLDTTDYVKERCYFITGVDDEYYGTAFNTKEYGMITCSHLFVNKDTVGNVTQYINKTDDNKNIIEDINIEYIAKKSNNSIKYINPIININIDNVKSDIVNFRYDKRKKSFDKVNLDYIPKIGEEVIAFGYGNYANEEKYNFRIVTYKITNVGECYYGKYYCVDKPIIHGMSGGPVLNSNLEVIGVISRGTGDRNADLDSTSPNSGDNGFILLNSVKDLIDKY